MERQASCCRKKSLIITFTFFKIFQIIIWPWNAKHLVVVKNVCVLVVPRARAPRAPVRARKLQIVMIFNNQLLIDIFWDRAHWEEQSFILFSICLCILYTTLFLSHHWVGSLVVPLGLIKGGHQFLLEVSPEILHLKSKIKLYTNVQMKSKRLILFARMAY